MLNSSGIKQHVTKFLNSKIHAWNTYQLLTHFKMKTSLLVCFSRTKCELASKKHKMTIVLELELCNSLLVAARVHYGNTEDMHEILTIYLPISKSRHLHWYALVVQNVNLLRKSIK